jgi:hypothetical protein
MLLVSEDADRNGLAGGTGTVVGSRDDRVAGAAKVIVSQHCKITTQIKRMINSQ